MNGVVILALVLSVARFEEGSHPQRIYQQLKPVPFNEVNVQDGFWTPRIKSNVVSTVPHCFEWCEKTGRISNFAKAAKLMDGEFEGIYFNDSDVYKVLEGAAYSLQLYPSAELEAQVDAVIDKIAAAQQENGYINTYFTLVEPDRRWTNLRVMHELYCYGHLIEAAVAYYNATGKRKFLDVAGRAADLVDTIFGPEQRHGVPGHEEIELALVKLYEATEEERYLNLAQFFIDERGRGGHRELYGETFQDHVPVREQTEIVGHAVRAMYLFSAVADLAAYTGDQGYITAMNRIWRDTTSRKMYITGGIGVWGYHEGFAKAFDLPNDTAYSETCASIAFVLWAHRLNLLHGDARYADMVETELYNGALSGVSLDGSKFFYVNPMMSRGPATFNTSGGREGESHQHRQEWFGCACCPSNVVRFIPTVGGYAYASTYNGVYLNLYMSGETTIALQENTVALKQETRYPWEGDVKLIVTPEKPGEFSVNLRIPGWCANSEIQVNGKRVESPLIRNGYAVLERFWNSGDTVELKMDLPIRRMETRPEVQSNLGRVALQRGPIVYCLEGVDNQNSVLNLSLPQDAKLKAEFKPDLLEGVITIEGQALARIDNNTSDELYRPHSLQTRRVRFTAIPYYAWDNRTPGPMVVWLPQHPAMAEGGSTLAMQSNVSSSYANPGDFIGAVNDGRRPIFSSDKNIPRFTWWEHRGTQEWIQYDFSRTATVTSCDVYWYDDRPTGECRTPRRWTVQWKDGEAWKEVAAKPVQRSPYLAFERVEFDPVTTPALRLSVELESGFSGGILEWEVEEGEK